MSIASSIAKHGLIAGILRHRGIQFIVMYFSAIGSLMLISAVAYEYAGKQGAIASMLLCMVALVVVLKHLPDKAVASRTNDDA